MTSFLEKYDREFAPLLASRAATFRMLFEWMDKFRYPPNIVETGCARTPGNWVGDGQSTVLFDAYVQAVKNSKAWSVDISAESIAGAKAAGVAYVELVQSDSIKFLSGFNAHIDVLYLDSLDFDVYNSIQSEQHHLFELCAAQRWLHKHSLVMVDDTYRQNGVWRGKGRLVAAYMEIVGASLLTEEQECHGACQALWELTK